MGYNISNTPPRDDGSYRPEILELFLRQLVILGPAS